jgi:hypothetical protein
VNRTAAAARVDEIARMRLATFLDGACPSCEGLIETEGDDESRAFVRHGVDCPVEIGELERLVADWEIPIGVVVLDRRVGNRIVRYAGPVRLPDPPVDVPDHVPADWE